MAFDFRYEGDSAHMLTLIAQAVLADDDWHVEATTQGGDRTVEGLLVGVSPSEPQRTAGAVTIRPWDYREHKATGEPDVTLDVEDIEELVIP